MKEKRRKTPRPFLDQEAADQAASCVHSFADTLDIRQGDRIECVPGYFCLHPKRLDDRGHAVLCRLLGYRLKCRRYKPWLGPEGI